jgi:hypothetical protein
VTGRKDDLRLPPRTPAFVDREVGAAELRISPETWDKWVKQGILPAPAPGFPAGSPRWRWADVDRKLVGQEKPDHDDLAEATRAFFGKRAGRKRALA